MDGHCKLTAAKRKTTNYVTVAQSISRHSANLGHLLEALMKRNIERKEPLLGCLIVKKESGLPAKGFFECAEQLLNISFDGEDARTRFFEEQKEKCFRKYSSENDTDRELWQFIEALTPDQAEQAKALLDKKDK